MKRETQLYYTKPQPVVDHRSLHLLLPTLYVSFPIVAMWFVSNVIFDIEAIFFRLKAEINDRRK